MNGWVRGRCRVLHARCAPGSGLPHTPNQACLLLPCVPIPTALHCIALPNCRPAVLAPMVLQFVRDDTGNIVSIGAGSQAIVCLGKLHGTLPVAVKVSEPTGRGGGLERDPGWVAEWTAEHMHGSMCGQGGLERSKRSCIMRLPLLLLPYVPPSLHLLAPCRLGLT